MFAHSLTKSPAAVEPETKAAIIIKNCERFLEGAWQGLALAAQQDQGSGPSARIRDRPRLAFKTLKLVHCKD